MKLSPAVTVWLDLVRVIAALAVMASHYSTALFPDMREPVFGHDAVVVFFVLSGFVIAFVCDQRDQGPLDYGLSRLVRLWSVAIPALALGVCIRLFLGSTPELPAPAAPNGSWSYVIIGTISNLLFLGENWGVTISAPFNAPFWSLNYEAWYYACYGAFVFLTGRTRWIVTTILCALAGPKIMILAPCWLAGVALYHWRDRIRLSNGVAIAVFATSFLAYAAINELELTRISRDWLKAMTGGQSWRLHSSQGVIGDYILTVVVMMNFIGAAHMASLGRFILPFRRPISWASSYTLSIYLYHIPLLVILLHGVRLDPADGVLPRLTIIGLALGGIVLLGLVTEHQRRGLRHLLTWRSPRRA